MVIAKSSTVKSSSYFGLFGKSKSNLTAEEKKQTYFMTFISCIVICCILIIGYILFILGGIGYFGGKQIIKQIKKE